MMAVCVCVVYVCLFMSSKALHAIVPVCVRIWCIQRVMHVCLYKGMCVYMGICVCICGYMCVSMLCMRICVYVYENMWVYMPVRTCVCAYEDVYMRTCVYI